MAGTSDKIMGLLNNPRMMDFGMGLLSAGGPSFTPHNVGQDIASAYQYANGREGQRAQLEMQRAQLSQQKQIMAQQQRQAAARKQYQGILSHPAASVPASIRAPGAVANEPAQMEGLLAQAYPEQYGQAAISGLLSGGQSGAKNSTAYNDLEDVLGRPPTMAELSAHENPPEPPNPSQQLADQLAAQQIQANLDDKAEKTRLTNTELRTQATGRTRSMEEIERIVGLMEDVEGTSVQPGIIAENIGDLSQLQAAILDALGGDSTAARKRATQFGTLNKGFDRLVNRVLPETFTNSVFDFIKGQNMGVGQELGVNADIMISTIKQVLDDDFNSDGDYDLDQDQAKKLIGRLEAMRERALGGGASGPPVVTSQAEYDALEVGAEYIEDGVTWVKQQAEGASTGIPAYLTAAKEQAEAAIANSGLVGEARTRGQAALDAINAAIGEFR